MQPKGEIEIPNRKQFLTQPNGYKNLGNLKLQLPNLPTSFPRFRGLLLLPCHGVFVAGHHLLELPLAGHRAHLIAHLGRQLQAWSEEREAAADPLAVLAAVAVCCLFQEVFPRWKSRLSIMIVMAFPLSLRWFSDHQDQASILEGTW